ncbi:MAG TPA: FHA domain-containing protein [Cellvibrio sp.]|nr:FHA domain-containing protein [Cellvibrio sp.]
MSSAYFIEILNNSGEVQSRQKFSSLPIRIGRGYGNDIILDDPHTAAEHAIVDNNEEGLLIIRNCASHNGIRVKGQAAKQRQDSFNIHGDSVFHLGHTQVRVRTQEYAVAPEIIDGFNHRWEGWPLALLAISLIGIIAFNNAWLSDIENNKTTAYIINICMWFGYSLLWAGIWALANRVFGGTAHFSRHLLILGCGLTLLYIWGYLSITLAYAFSWTLLTRFGNHSEIFILAIIIYFHLRQITPRRGKRLKVICAALALLGSALVLMKNYQSSNQYADELYMDEILPPAVRMSRNHSLEEFNENISQLKTAVDEEREKAKKEKEKQ